MNCLIIEDEKLAAERLVNQIKRYDSSIEVLGVIQSISKAVTWFQTTEVKPDLVFVDIHLSDGLSFEIFEQVEIAAPLIFTTAYDEYALKAFKVNSIDYILKPLQYAELCRAIDKFKANRVAVKPSGHVFGSVLKTLTNSYKSKFAIKVGEHIRVIQVDDVQCFFSAEKATFLQNKEGRDYAVNYSLDQLEELVSPQLFFRVSRKCIVAFSAIKDIVSYSNSRLRLCLKAPHEGELIVSRERVVEFKKWLES